MAIKINQIGGSPVAAAFKDSRAEGYVTYYTKAGWDRWKLSAEQVAQLVAEQKLEYQKAMDIYKQQLKGIDDTKAALEKKLIDIQTKKANAAIAQDMVMRRAEQAAQASKNKAETERAKLGAYHPSWAWSIGESFSEQGNAFTAAGGKDLPTDLMTGVNNRDAAVQAITNVTSTSNDYQSAAKGAQEYYNNIKNNNLDGTEYGRDVQLYTLFTSQAAKLAAQEGTSKEAAGEAIEALIAQQPDGNIILGAINGGEKKAMDRAAGKGGGSVSNRQSAAGGGYYGDYNVPLQPIADQKIDTSAFDDAEKGVKKQLEDLGTSSAGITVPTMEPIDVIAAARKTYMEKFGDVPRGVQLNFGNGTYAQYKNLLPYELTDGVKKTQKFFAMYIDDAVAKAKAKAQSEGRTITTDELNTATEAGKAAARQVLFGGVVAADKKVEAETGVQAPPNPIDKSAGIPGTSPQDYTEDQNLRTGRSAADYKNAAAMPVPLNPLEYPMGRGFAPEIPGAPYRYDYSKATPEPYVAPVYPRATSISSEIPGAPSRYDYSKVTPEPYTAPVYPRATSISQEIPGAPPSRYDYSKVQITPNGPVLIPQPQPVTPSAGKRQVQPTPQTQPMVGPPMKPYGPADIPPSFVGPPMKPYGPSDIPPSFQGPPMKPYGPADIPPSFQGPPMKPYGPADIPPSFAGPPMKPYGAEYVPPSFNPPSAPPPSLKLNIPDLSGVPVMPPPGLSIPPSPLSPVIINPTVEGYVPKNNADLQSLGLQFTPPNKQEGYRAPTPPPTSGLLSPSAAPVFQQLENRPPLPTQDLKAPSGKTPGVNTGEFLKNRVLPTGEVAPVPTPQVTTPKVDSLGQADKRAKTQAVIAATNTVMQEPKVAAKAIVKDNMGKYVASLYDENKSKGATAASLGDLTSTVIREYSGDPTKQKKAVELLTQLALLDSTSNQIRSS